MSQWTPLTTPEGPVRAWLARPDPPPRGAVVDGKSVIHPTGHGQHFSGPVREGGKKIARPECAPRANPRAPHPGHLLSAMRSNRKLPIGWPEGPTIVAVTR